MNNLQARFVVAALALPALFLLIYKAPTPVVWAFVSIASVIATWELATMFLTRKQDAVATTVFAGVTAILQYWLPIEHAVIFATYSVAIASGIYFVLARTSIENAAKAWSTTLVAVVYCVGFFSYLAYMKRDWPLRGADLIFLTCGIAWAGDTGAYFAGKFLGKKKLHPRISPNKTWAGAVGGVLASVTLSYLVCCYRIPELDNGWYPLLLGGIGSVLCQFGDLLESLLKRATKVKDSGTILPGHGGILDRIDALLFACPWVYGFYYFVVTAQ